MFWGMLMSTKGKVLFVWILVLMALSFLFSHFWGCTVYALERAVATNFVFTAVMGKLAEGMAAGIFSMAWTP